MLLTALMLAAATVPPGEQPVEPYAESDANAGARAFAGDAMWHAFHERAGVDRIVTRMGALNRADPRISDIFKGQDLVRLHRLLIEQFCYILGGGCPYSGRDMRASHADLGVQTKDLNALIENLQRAMREEGVPFAAQNRFLAKLAPMKRDIIER